jgi:transcriptional/translational regulatory protein YebC/TACO1
VALDVFEKASLVPVKSELTMLPKSVVTLNEEEGQKIISLLEKLEEDDDVQNVYANFDLVEA